MVFPESFTVVLPENRVLILVQSFIFQSARVSELHSAALNALIYEIMSFLGAAWGWGGEGE